MSGQYGRHGMPHLWTFGDEMRRAFTLIEFLVVLTIILLVSLLALPTILPAIRHRQVSEGARIVQGALAGARDAAIRDNRTAGIRLLPDPNFSGIDPTTGKVSPYQALAYNRIIPIEPAPNYSDGLIQRWSGSLPLAVGGLPYPGPGTAAASSPTWGQTTVLMVYQVAFSYDSKGTKTLNVPTNWYWNIRAGDKIQPNNAGRWYTIVGPMTIQPGSGNPEMFINVGLPGTASPLLSADGDPIEFLLLVNGLDDNKNGWTDEGWDGIDNDGVNGIDDIGEWLEVESW